MLAFRLLHNIGTRHANRLPVHNDVSHSGCLLGCAVLAAEEAMHAWAIRSLGSIGFYGKPPCLQASLLHTKRTSFLIPFSRPRLRSCMYVAGIWVVPIPVTCVASRPSRNVRDLPLKGQGILRARDNPRLLMAPMGLTRYFLCPCLFRGGEGGPPHSPSQHGAQAPDESATPLTRCLSLWGSFLLPEPMPVSHGRQGAMATCRPRAYSGAWNWNHDDDVESEKAT